MKSFEELTQEVIKEVDDPEVWAKKYRDEAFKLANKNNTELTDPNSDYWLYQSKIIILKNLLAEGIIRLKTEDPQNKKETFRALQFRLKKNA